MAIPFKTDDGYGSRARLGLVVLQSDESIEPELARLPTALNGVSIHHSRIASAPDVTRATLSEMHARLPQSVAMLPTGVSFDVIGYGCTSGATIIGEQAVDQAVQSVQPGVAVTNPLSALKAACQTMQLRSLGLITPYEKSVTLAMADNLTDHQIRVAAVHSFEQTSEATVARISPASLQAALVDISTQTPDCDAWFVSCTNLRMAGITDAVEQRLGKPVLSSNQVLAWHMLRLAGVNDPLPGWGKLLLV